nr:secreted protein [Thraustotheca clavata]
MNLLWTTTIVVILNLCEGKCRNACSGHGFCNTFNVCACQRGFLGGDCSQMQCPLGKAWGVITGTDVAHSMAECSGRGICDRTTGVCTCQLGFQGSACQQVACSSSCSGRGQCLTLQQLAATPLIAMNLYNQPPYQYSPLVMWDADMIQGCLCDGTNTGFDCALKQCHLGDDPMTTGQTEEIQLIQCSASYLGHQIVLQFDSALTAGSFVLNFGVQRTDPISYNAPADNALGTSMREMLQSLSIIPSVSVAQSVTSNSITWDIVFPPTATEQHIFRPTWRVVEVQQFFCAADSGFLTITYGSQAFSNIPFSASTSVLQTTLQTFYKIGAVTVSYSTGTTLCNALGNYVTIAFNLMRDRNNIGDLPALLIDATNQNQPNALAWGLNAPVVDKQAIELVKGIDTCYVPEVQSIACCATSGFFAITFEGRTLSNLPFNIAPTELKTQLLATLTQLLEIDVVYSTGSAACSLLAPANVISITFAVVTTNGPAGNGVLSPITTDFTNGGVSGLAHTSPNLLRLSTTATQVVRGARCVPLNANYAAQPTAQITSKIIQGGGAFTIAFRGATTLPIQAAASPSDVAKALLRLPTLKGIDVIFTSGEACSTPPNIIRLNFTGDFGILPSVSAVPTSNAVAINVYTGGAIEPTTSMASVSSTKESLECSSRGTCDAALTGACTCFSGYTASDGRGNPASAIMRRDDCGAPIITVSSCPGDVPCSGHGICSGPPSYACTCAKGWRNGDCSQRLCPQGLSWFSYPSGNNLAHRDMIECSGVGSCDRATATCSCQTPFKGGACELMACGGVNTPCSGGGQCLTLNEIAPLTTVNGVPAGFTYGADPNNPSTWDAFKIQSCVCDALHSGYDCSQLTCPYGDDPNTYLDVMEVQYAQCIATSGTFALTFRGLTTSDIAWDADLSTVQTALNAITSGVTVQFSGANTVACSTSGVVLGITFLLDYGALPCLVPNNALLVDLINGNGQPGSATLNVACGGTIIAGFTSVVGTRENAICSNHGVCDRTTGTCICEPFFASSDGLGGPGTRGDCGYRKQFNDQSTSS